MITDEQVGGRNVVRKNKIMGNVQPNYKLIYQDIISRKYPEKQLQCQQILNKKQLSTMDVIKLNNIIFDHSNKEAGKFNQMLRSYDKTTILEILDYQKAYKLNNTQLSIKFKLSRNTIGKWKKIFLV